MTTSTRWILAVALLCGCGDDGVAPVTVDAKVADAVATDAPVDAPPDAPADARLDAPPPSSDITTACMDVCNAIGVCFGKSPGPDCETGCAADLADCTPQQVMDVDACSQVECGDKGEAIALCLQQVTCVDE